MDRWISILIPDEPKVVALQPIDLGHTVTVLSMHLQEPLYG